MGYLNFSFEEPRVKGFWIVWCLTGAVFKVKSFQSRSSHQRVKGKEQAEMIVMHIIFET